MGGGSVGATVDVAAEGSVAAWMARGVRVGAAVAGSAVTGASVFVAGGSVFVVVASSSMSVVRDSAVAAGASGSAVASATSAASGVGSVSTKKANGTLQMQQAARAVTRPRMILPNGFWLLNCPVHQAVKRRT